MTRIQTRRSVSLKQENYNKIHALCEKLGVSVSGYLNKAINDKLDALGFPKEKSLEHQVKKRPEKIARYIRRTETPALEKTPFTF